MSDVIPSITFVSNLFIKQMVFRKTGDKEYGHSHCYDHVTLLSKGSLQIEALGKTTDFKAPIHIYIKAGVVHELTALEDDTLAHCIHALRESDGSGDIIDPASIPDGVVPSYYPFLEENVQPAKVQG
jgi:quercetin dioxygenase-like cupin family protein